MSKELSSTKYAYKSIIKQSISIFLENYIKQKTKSTHVIQMK